MMTGFWIPVASSDRFIITLHFPDSLCFQCGPRHSRSSNNNNKNNNSYFIAPMWICSKRFTKAIELKRKLYEIKMQSTMIRIK